MIGFLWHLLNDPITDNAGALLVVATLLGLGLVGVIVGPVGMVETGRDLMAARRGSADGEAARHAIGNARRVPADLGDEGLPEHDRAILDDRPTMDAPTYAFPELHPRQDEGGGLRNLRRASPEAGGSVTRESLEWRENLERLERERNELVAARRVVHEDDRALITESGDETEETMTERGGHATAERDGDPTVSAWPIAPEMAQPAGEVIPAGEGRGPDDLYGVNVTMGPQGMSAQANPRVAIALIRAFADAMAVETGGDAR